MSTSHKTAQRAFPNPEEQRIYNDGFAYGRGHASLQATELHGQSPEQAAELYDRTGTGDEAWYEHFEESPMSGEWADGPSMRDLFSPEEYAQLSPEEEQDLSYIWREGYDDGLVAGVQTLAEPLGRMDDPGGTYLPEGWTSAKLGGDEYEETKQQNGGIGQEAPEATSLPQGQVEFLWPTTDEAVELSHYAVDNHQGFRDPQGFDAAVHAARHQQTLGGINDLYTLAAHLVNSVQRQQALVEGNKRTASLLGLHFLEENGVDTEALPPEEFGELVVMMAEKQVTPEQVGEYLRTHLSPRIAALHIASFLGWGIPFERLAKFILQADWNDVMAKAKRLVQEGKVTILHNTPQSVISQVIGDGSDNDDVPDTHQVELAREDPDSNVLTQTVCDCAYNQFRWDRTGPWKKNEGRPCSHILATYWKAKSTPIDGESVPAGYQAPVGQKGPAVAPGQQKLPGMSQPVQPPTPEQFQQQSLPSTQQTVTPPQPTNPFNPSKQPGGGGQKPPVPQRQQLDLFSVNPASAGPAADPAGGVSVPGGTPPTPENPVMIPGTFSRWKEAMAERSGDPQLDALIEKYLTRPSPSGTTRDDYEGPRDPLVRDQSSLACHTFAEDFADFLVARGIKAWSTDEEVTPGTIDSFNPDAHGYQDRSVKGVDYHVVTRVEMPTGTYMVDWTAAQYGYKEFPMVQRQNGEQWEREWTGR